MPIPTFPKPVANALSTLASAYVAGSGVLALTSATSFGTLAANEYLRVSIFTTGAPTGTKALSHLKVTAISGNNLTVAGTLDGFTDVNLPAGATICCAVSAGTFSEIYAAILALQPASAAAPIGATNFTHANTQNLRAGIAAVKAGTGRMRILFLGDSYTAGTYAGTPTTSNSNALGNNGRLGAFPDQIALQYANASTPVPAIKSAMIGNGSSGTFAMANLLDYDPRISYTGSVAGLPSFPSLGGNTDPILGTGTTNPSTISFTPALPFDTIEMITAGNSSANPSAGPIDVCVGPGSSPTVVTTITAAQINVQGPLKFVVTVPAGSTIATIRHTTGGANYIISLVTRNSAIPSVECMGAAASGGTVQTIAVAPALGAQAYNTRTVLPVILDNAANTHNLVVINGWYNDNAGGRTQAQVEADHQTLITQILALPNTDVMFNNYTTLNPNSIPSATFTSWSQAIIGYYTSQSLPSFDMSAVLPNFAAANAAGYMGDANLHLSASGHLLCAQSMKACFDYALTL